MSATISTAAHAYATRPQDERFPSLQALISNADADRVSSIERRYNARDLTAVVSSTGAVELASTKGAAKLTHWSFGQLARMVGAPAGYLRELPANLAANCLNHGIKDMPHGQDVQIMARVSNGTPQIRSLTSDSYGRVWDSVLYGAIADRIAQHDPSWQLPPTWSGESAGAYRGDRDSFLILVNGGSIVTDPSLSNGNGAMYRGLLVRNSEVGASSITIEQILFRYVCGNHMLWGAVVDHAFKRRHVGDRVLRDTIREISTIAYRWVQQSSARDESIIRGLINTEIAQTRDAVISELQRMGATKESATAAYEACERNESVSPRSFWGAAQGLTRVSQDSGYQDERFTLDKLAAQILAKGRKLVAA